VFSAETGITAVVAGDLFDQLPKPVQLGMQRIIDVTADIGITHSDQPSRFQDAPKFPQSIHRFGEVIQNGVRQNGIESEIIEREFVNGGAPELYVLEAALMACCRPISS
jgi:hypothetical protein